MPTECPFCAGDHRALHSDTCPKRVKRKIIVTLMHDEGSDEPEDNGWKLYSFSRRHRSYKNPDSFFPPTIGFRSKLRAGTAFVLSYFEHSNCKWSLKNEGPQDPWDSVGVAGVLVWEGQPVKDLPKTYAERQNWARQFLETYTCWCNGEVYGYGVSEVVTLPCGHTETRDLDSCFGFYGNDVKYMVEQACEHLEPGDEITLEGSASGIADVGDFVAPTKKEP